MRYYWYIQIKVGANAIKSQSEASLAMPLTPIEWQTRNYGCTRLVRLAQPFWQSHPDSLDFLDSIHPYGKKEELRQQICCPCDMLRSFATEKIPSLLVSHAVTDLTTPHHDYLILLCTCVGRGKQRLSRDTSPAYCKDLASEADWQTSAISGNFWPEGCILKMSQSKCEKFPLEPLII